MPKMWQTIFQNLKPFSDALIQCAQQLGLKNLAFLGFFVAAHVWNYYLYRGRLNDKQKQIDAIAKENREYRERFLKFVDDHLKTAPVKKGKK